MSALGQKRTIPPFHRCPPLHSKSGHLIDASWDYPFFMNRRTCSTGQSLLALITRTREPSARSISAWEQNSSLISETRRSVVGSQFKVKARSPGQIRHKEPSSSSTILLLS